MLAEQMSVDGEPPAPSGSVYVRSVAAEEQLSVQLVYRAARGDGGPVPEERRFNFLRTKTEPLERLCQRIGHNIRNSATKKSKKKKKRLAAGPAEGDAAGPGLESAPPKVAVLTAAGAPVAESASIAAALQAGHLLCIGEARYRVVLNAPSVAAVRLPRQTLLHCPVCVEVEAEFCAAADCRVTWSVHRAATAAKAPPPADDPGWQAVHEGLAVTFTAPGDVGAWVKAAVLPQNSLGEVCGLEQTAVSLRPIAAGPTLASPIRRRHAATLQAAPPGALRIVSYNILADLYADSDHSRDALYPYCPRDCLEAGYRRAVVLWELSGYRADLVCLQEVDEALYRRCLRPVLCDSGEYEGALLLKGKKTAEGVAIFYRRAKFELVEERSLASVAGALFELGKAEGEAGAEFGPVAEAVRQNEKFGQKWSERNQCLLALVLRCREEPGRLLCVATTHLFFHPNADHVRLLQAAVCLKHLARVRRAVMEARPDCRCGVLFAGDFNSDPRNAVLELALEGRTRPTTADWYSCGRDEFIGQPVLSHDLRLASAYDPKAVDFTNYTAGFRGTLDYILYDTDAFRQCRPVSLPSVEEVTRKVALPNEFFPSDHLALVADLQLA